MFAEVRIEVPVTTNLVGIPTHVVTKVGRNYPKYRLFGEWALV